MFMKSEEDQKSNLMDAFFAVIDEFEENPLRGKKNNDTLINILSDRVEEITNSTVKGE